MAFWDFLRTKQPPPRARTIPHPTRLAIHDAAAKGRRLKEWQPSQVDINALLQGDGDMIIRRSRHAVQHNPYAANAKEAYGAYLVGGGIMPSLRIDDTERRETVMQLWNRWCKRADADSLTTLFGLQHLIAKELFDAGECFVRYRPRRANDGLTVPLQLQLLPSEMVDRTYTTELPKQNGQAVGHRIRSGVEFNGLGRRVAYWMWNKHPGDTTSLSSLKRQRIPAGQILHILVVEQPGQVRGKPKILPGLIRLYLLDQYDDAELERKKVAALLAGFITSPEPDEVVTGESDATPDTEGAVETPWEPGTMHMLEPGEEITFSNPSDVGANYDVFQRRNLYAISAAWALPYSVVTGDHSQANYSSQRSALIDLRRRIVPLQTNFLVPQFCQPVWERWLDTAFLVGALSDPADVEDLKEDVRWIPPKWEWVDPEKDRKAEKIAVDEGFKPRSEVIEAEGGDPQQTDRRIAQDRLREKELDLDLGDRNKAEGDDPPIQEVA